MTSPRLRRIYKRFLKPVVKPSVKWLRKRLKWLRKRLRSARSALHYVSALLVSVRRHPANLWYMPTWIGSLWSSRPPLAVLVPNWPYVATRHLQKQLHRLSHAAPATDGVSRRLVRSPHPGVCRCSAVVFEYGGGSSTLWLAERVKSVTTVEHDAGWFTRIEQKLAELGLTNCVVLFREPEHVDTATPAAANSDGISYLSQKCPGSFAAYVRTIDEFPDDSIDLVFVDGRSRAACLYHAARKVRPGGMLILDDSDREHYQHAVQRLRAWVRKDFCGIKPFESKLGYTTCWTKPEARTELELVRAAGFTGVAGADRQEITHSNPERSVPRGSRPGPGQNS